MQVEDDSLGLIDRLLDLVLDEGPITVRQELPKMECRTLRVRLISQKLLKIAMHRTKESSNGERIIGQENKMI